MKFLELKKGDIAFYKGNKPYILANGQRVEEAGEIMINSDVKVQNKFFSVKAAPKVEKPQAIEKEEKKKTEKKNK